MLDFATVIDSTDLVELAEKAGAKLHKTQTEYRGNCPLHNGDNINAFSIYKESGKQKWKCFSRDCGQGDAIDFVQKWLGYDKKAAVEYLGGKQIDPIQVARIATERAERIEKELAETIARAQTILDELRAAKAWMAYHSQLEQDDQKRQLWRIRGIPDFWQDNWQLGYCPNFKVGTNNGTWLTPTLTIPIFDKNSQPINLRHRLLNPPAPNDKYRPDRPGLKASPFICDYENELDNVLVVEGEIKSMVTYITLDSNKWQVIGIPGKTASRDLIPSLAGKQVVICLDPDALNEAEALARLTGGRIIEIAVKIDDAINAGSLDKDMLRKLIRASRKIQ